MSLHHLKLIPFVVAATLVLVASVACQTSPPRLRRGVNLACFETLAIHRHLDRPDSRRVLDIRPQRERNEYLPLARHHIIPYATMRDFYNNVLRNDQAAFTRLFNDVIYPAAEARGVLTTLGALDYEVYHLPELRELTGTYLRIRTVDQVHLIQQVYAWLPFNIYLGPTPDRREDDERANVFDRAARPIIGDYQADIMLSLYADIGRYNTEINSVSVTSIINDMAGLVRLRQEPYDFNPAQWRVRTRINTFRFRTATEDIVDDESSWRRLRTDDYCKPDRLKEESNNQGQDQLIRRKREDHPTECLLLEDNNDPFCINTLNNVRESVQDGTITLAPTIVIRLNSTGEGQHPDYGQVLDPRPKLTASGWVLHLITFGMWP